MPTLQVEGKETILRSFCNPICIKCMNKVIVKKSTLYDEIESRRCGGAL
jgi:hypothetical protein